VAAIAIRIAKATSSLQMSLCPMMTWSALRPGQPAFPVLEPPPEPPEPPAGPSALSPVPAPGVPAKEGVKFGLPQDVGVYS